MEYVKIAKVRDFDQVNRKLFRVMARQVAVLKLPDGTFRAMEFACRHEGADLSGGRVEGNVVTCPWHGWKYDTQTGECLWGAETRLRPYGLKVEGENIYITLRPEESP